MPAASKPPTEDERLASLSALDLLDSTAEVVFDELTRAAARVCGTPISLISLVDKDRQWFKANVGLEDTTETHRDSAFCAHALDGPAPLEVADATLDPRFSDNPLVLGAPGIRFYAGFPLQLRNGSVIGTLCVIDRRPRHLSDAQREILGHLSRSAVALMESRHARRLADLAEGSIRAFESRWRGVFQNLHDGFVLGEVVRDDRGNAVDWRYIDVNASWSRMMGVPEDRARGRTVREVLPGIEQEWVDQGLDVIGRGAPMVFERQVGVLDRWYEGRATWIGGERFVISFCEVTQRRLAQRHREALLELSDVLNALPDAASMLAHSSQLVGRMLNVDVAGYGRMLADDETLEVQCDWTQPGVPSTVGLHWLPRFGEYLEHLRQGRKLVVDDVHQARSMHAEACKAMGAVSFLNIPVIEQGRLVAIFFVLSRQPKPWSQSPEYVTFLQEAADRTRNAVERKKAEKALETLSASLARQVHERTAELQHANTVLAAKVEALTAAEDALRQAQKMEAIGQLTGGIAHDFNNLLASISGSLQVLRLRLEKGTGGDLQRYIRMGMESVTRAATLTQRLLAFSRRQALDPKPVDVGRLVAGMQDLLHGTVGPGVQVAVMEASDLWLTLIDAAQLENSVLNLCINGRDAMAPQGGRLTIETANRWLNETVARELELQAGPYVVLSVSDTGMGMSPAVVSRAFDPFFTTKPTGQGTGLGLSMVYGFVRQSGGQVRILSEVGQGTTVYLYLPRSVASMEAGSAIEVDEDSPTSGHETILVVEDEATLRQLVTEILVGAGYGVLAAATGTEALARLSSDAEVHLLITDVGLPGGMNGRQVADAARVLRPDLSVIFMTGYAENAIVGNGVLDAGMAIVTKPFEVARLLKKVRAMLDAADSGRN